MKILVLMFKIFFNIPNFIRGGVICCKSVFYKNVLVRSKFRVGNGSTVRLYPGCHCQFKGDNVIGMRSLISVLPKANLCLGKGVGVGSNNQIICHQKIEIQDNTILGPNVMIFDHNHQFDSLTGVKHRQFDTGEIVIGKNTWIGASCIILKDVHIGNNVIVAAGSVVTKNIPNNVVVAGVPAKIIKEL